MSKTRKNTLNKWKLKIDKCLEKQEKAEEKYNTEFSKWKISKGQLLEKSEDKYDEMEKEIKLLINKYGKDSEQVNKFTKKMEKLVKKIEKLEIKQDKFKTQKRKYNIMCDRIEETYEQLRKELDSSS
jgi:hypothetical protein